jgi:hypothetical protein
MWSWLDPLTAIAAIERLRPARPDVRLAFVGLNHPDPIARDAHAPLAAKAQATVRELGLDDVVLFRPRWLSRDEYVHHLMDADVAVSLHGPTLEGRFATRSRILDYLSAGLPVVCSAGDVMSVYVERRRLGTVVEAGDVDGCAQALDQLLDGERRRIAPEALETLLWSNVARPLVEYCVGGAPWAGRTQAHALLRAVRDYPTFLRSFLTIAGTHGVRHKITSRAAAALRRRV